MTAECRLSILNSWLFPPDEDVVLVFEEDGHLTIDVRLITGLKEFRNGSGASKRKR